MVEESKPGGASSDCTDTQTDCESLQSDHEPLVSIHPSNGIVSLKRNIESNLWSVIL